MIVKLPKLIATSVVRGGEQGESHGGIFTIDFETQECEQRAVNDFNDYHCECVSVVPLSRVGAEALLACGD